MSLWKSFWLDEQGQDLTEYVLLLAFIALTTAGLVVAPMTSVNQIWVAGNSELSTAASTAASCSPGKLRHPPVGYHGAMEKLPAFQNEPYTDFSTPANRRAMDEALAEGARTARARVPSADRRRAAEDRRFAALGQPVEPARGGRHAPSRHRRTGAPRGGFGLRLFPRMVRHARGRAHPHAVARGRHHPPPQAGIRRLAGATKPARPGRKRMPTSPKPSISANITRARCSGSAVRNRRTCNCPASTTNCATCRWAWAW